MDRMTPKLLEIYESLRGALPSEYGLDVRPGIKGGVRIDVWEPSGCYCVPRFIDDPWVIDDWYKEAEYVAKMVIGSLNRALEQEMN